MNARRLRALLLAAALSAPAAARAGELEIAPILVELSGAARSATVVLRNGGGTPARYEVRALDWAQKPDGGMELSPTRELVVFPPLLELGPGESRSIRLGTELRPGATERAWRLMVEELPRADGPPGASHVAVLTRVGVPVFLLPAKSTAKATLAFLPAEGNRIRVRLANEGSTRLRPRAAALKVVGPDGSPLLERALDPWYVLAGGERIYEIEASAEACALAAEAVAAATLDTGVLEARAAPVPCRAP
jgi:fimbrial chaperone protein